MKSLQPMLLLGIITLTLTSCLTTEVELDLTKRDDMELTLAYRMPVSLWQFGVYDEDSPERAIPVSRRDAEETAILYEDVTLETYSFEEQGDEAVITVVYGVKSIASLQGLWGRVAGRSLTLTFDEGSLVLPLSDAVPSGGVDAEQLGLIRDVFEDRTFRVSLHLPGALTDHTVPVVDDAEWELTEHETTFTWVAPMAALLTATTDQVISVAWEE